MAEKHTPGRSREIQTALQRLDAEQAGLETRVSRLLEIVADLENEKEELLEALRQMLPWLDKAIESGAFDSVALPRGANIAAKTARAAIARAEGKA